MKFSLRSSNENRRRKRTDKDYFKWRRIIVSTE